MIKLISAAEDSWVRVWHLSLTPETNIVEVKTTHRQKQYTTVQKFVVSQIVLKEFNYITQQDALNWSKVTANAFIKVMLSLIQVNAIY